MRLGALDFVERVRRRDQHFLRHAAAIGARSAEQIRLYHSNREPRFPCRCGHTHASIAAAEDYDVKASRGHASILSES